LSGRAVCGVVQGGSASGLMRRLKTTTAPPQTQRQMGRCA